MPRKSDSNEQVWERRRGIFEEWLAGTPVSVLAEKYELHRDQIRQDVLATIKLLSDYDGLEKISSCRSRVLGQLWREVELATKHEFAALDGVPAEDVDKHGNVVEFKLVDLRAAAAYQGNRLKALASIERLMGLAKAAPDPKGEQAAASWSELVRRLHAKKEAEKAAADGGPVQ